MHMHIRIVIQSPATSADLKHFKVNKEFILLVQENPPTAQQQQLTVSFVKSHIGFTAYEGSLASYAKYGTVQKAKQ